MFDKAALFLSLFARAILPPAGVMAVVAGSVLLSAQSNAVAALDFASDHTSAQQALSYEHIQIPLTIFLGAVVTVFAAALGLSRYEREKERRQDKLAAELRSTVGRLEALERRVRRLENRDDADEPSD